MRHASLLLLSANNQQCGLANNAVAAPARLLVQVTANRQLICAWLNDTDESYKGFSLVATFCDEIVVNHPLRLRSEAGIFLIV